MISLKINTSYTLKKNQFRNTKSGKHAKFRVLKNARAGCPNRYIPQKKGFENAEQNQRN